MSSGIVQLIAIGAQDEHIIGEPEISFFTSTFKRHSNFSQSVEKQTIQGAVKGNSMSSIKFERNGDLLGYTYFTIDDNAQAIDLQDWGDVIDKVELLVAGQVIDVQDYDFSENIAVDMYAQIYPKVLTVCTPVHLRAHTFTLSAFSFVRVLNPPFLSWRCPTVL